MSSYLWLYRMNYHIMKTQIAMHHTCWLGRKQLIATHVLIEVGNELLHVVGVLWCVLEYRL